jgi:hypothetical protein
MAKHIESDFDTAFRMMLGMFSNSLVAAFEVVEDAEGVAPEELAFVAKGIRTIDGVDYAFELALTISGPEADETVVDADQLSFDFTKKTN